MFHVFSPLWIFLSLGTSRKQRDSGTHRWLKQHGKNRRVEDNIHSLLYAHTQTAESAGQIREHVVRAENLLQLSAAPVLDSRVRDALTEPVFDKSA